VRIAATETKVHPPVDTARVRKLRLPEAVVVPFCLPPSAAALVPGASGGRRLLDGTTRTRLLVDTGTGAGLAGGMSSSLMSSSRSASAGSTTQEPAPKLLFTPRPPQSKLKHQQLQQNHMPYLVCRLLIAVSSSLHSSLWLACLSCQKSVVSNHNLLKYPQIPCCIPTFNTPSCHCYHTASPTQASGSQSTPVKCTP
jgi:hypothetical protein